VFAEALLDSDEFGPAGLCDRWLGANIDRVTGEVARSADAGCAAVSGGWLLFVKRRAASRKASRSCATSCGGARAPPAPECGRVGSSNQARGILRGRTRKSTICSVQLQSESCRSIATPATSWRCIRPSRSGPWVQISRGCAARAFPQFCATWVARTAIVGRRTRPMGFSPILARRALRAAYAMPCAIGKLRATRRIRLLYAQPRWRRTGKLVPRNRGKNLDPDQNVNGRWHRTRWRRRDGAAGLALELDGADCRLRVRRGKIPS